MTGEICAMTISTEFTTGVTLEPIGETCALTGAMFAGIFEKGITGPHAATAVTFAKTSVTCTKTAATCGRIAATSAAISRDKPESAWGRKTAAANLLPPFLIIATGPPTAPLAY